MRLATIPRGWDDNARASEEESYASDPEIFKGGKEDRLIRRALDNDKWRIYNHGMIKLDRRWLTRFCLEDERLRIKPLCVFFFFFLTEKKIFTWKIVTDN